MRHGSVSTWTAIAITAACVCQACTEDPLAAVDPDSAPGISTPTTEIVLDAGDLPSWRDTAYTGFFIPSGADFILASDRAELSARVLGRIASIPDSVFLDSARVAIDSFNSAVIRLTFDTVRSAIPEGGVELAVWSLGKSFDADEATWEIAGPGDPWGSPGGDLTDLLGRDTLSASVDTLIAQPDSFRIPLAVDADSLVRRWQSDDGEPGFAIVASGLGADVRIDGVALVAEAVPAGSDTVVSVVRSAVPSSFIIDPPTPAVTTRLRLAGMPSARYYVDFTLPDSLGPIELRGATINRAALEFTPAPRPGDPFAVDEFLTAQAVGLLADPFEFGEKTPIGSGLGAFVGLDPDSLAAGQIARYDITSLIRTWSSAGSDSIPLLRVGVLPIPENRELGFWEFYSVEDGPGQRPAIRILFTPAPSFPLP